MMTASVLDDLRSSLPRIPVVTADNAGARTVTALSFPQNGKVSGWNGTRSSDHAAVVRDARQSPVDGIPEKVADFPQGRTTSIRGLNDMARLFGDIEAEYKSTGSPVADDGNHPLSPYRERINRNVFPAAFQEKISGITEQMKNRKQGRPSLYGEEKPSLYE